LSRPPPQAGGSSHGQRPTSGAIRLAPGRQATGGSDRVWRASFGVGADPFGWFGPTLLGHTPAGGRAAPVAALEREPPRAPAPVECHPPRYKCERSLANCPA